MHTRFYVYAFNSNIFKMASKYRHYVPSRLSMKNRAVNRTLIGGGGDIHISVLRPTNFFSNKSDFKRNKSGITRKYEYPPLPN